VLSPLRITVGAVSSLAQEKIPNKDTTKIESIIFFIICIFKNFIIYM